MFLAIHYPSWIKPEIFPGVPFLGLLRWYGLMYIFAFGTAILIFKTLVKEGALNTDDHITTDDDIYSFFTISILMLLLGARIFSTLVYDTSGIYLKKPWLIFWPFDKTGHFTGLTGMSYHGGFLGGFLGMLIWCIKNKRPILKWIDVMAVAIPLGYTFGRLGNFLNAELYGRVSTLPWGMIFPYAQPFSLSLDWVQEVIAKTGITVGTSDVLVNLPRHPSQLYEAFFEGIILFAILWSLRKHKPFDGFLTIVYTCGYGFFRFWIEYFREPDADIGYRISTQDNAKIYLNESLLNLSTGQILCLGMMIFAIILFIILAIKKRKKI